MMAAAEPGPRGKLPVSSRGLLALRNKKGRAVRGARKLPDLTIRNQCTYFLWSNKSH